MFGLFVVLALISIIGIILGGVGWILRKVKKQNVKLFKSICLASLGLIFVSTGGCAATVPKDNSQVTSGVASIATDKPVATDEPTKIPEQSPESSEVPIKTDNSEAAVSNTPKPSATPTTSAAKQNEDYDAVVTFPAEKYPETAAHILSAIENGESAVCTIDRNGADENRDESLDGIPTKDGYDRDEWPMAMCAEGGDGADIAYVTPSDNRGAGSWVGNQLDDFDDGARVLFVVESTVEPVATVKAEEPVTTSKPTSKPNPTTAPTKKPEPTEAPVPSKEPEVVKEIVYYANCAAVRDAGADPIYEGDPGYSRKLDRDGDGVGCE